MTVSEQIVNKIIHDLSGRAGIGDEWDQIDDDILEEIRTKWIEIVDTQIGRP